MRGKTSEVRHVGVRMPVELIDKIDKIANLNHRDRSGQIIHILSLFVDEWEIKNKEQKPSLLKVEEGWVD